MNGVSNKERAL